MRHRPAQPFRELRCSVRAARAAEVMEAPADYGYPLHPGSARSSQPGSQPGSARQYRSQPDSFRQYSSQPGTALHACQPGSAGSYGSQVGAAYGASHYDDGGGGEFGGAKPGHAGTNDFAQDPMQYQQQSQPDPEGGWQHQGTERWQQHQPDPEAWQQLQQEGPAGCPQPGVAPHHPQQLQGRDGQFDHPLHHAQDWASAGRYSTYAQPPQQLEANQQGVQQPGQHGSPHPDQPDGSGGRINPGGGGHPVGGSQEIESMDTEGAAMDGPEAQRLRELEAEAQQLAAEQKEVGPGMQEICDRSLLLVRLSVRPQSLLWALLAHAFVPKCEIGPTQEDCEGSLWRGRLRQSWGKGRLPSSFTL